METKICTECGLEKPLTEFVKNCCKKSGYNSYCKECHRKRCNKYYQNNKDKYKNRNRTTFIKIKDYLNSIKEKGCCICGEKEKCCLDFHHLRDKIDNICNLTKRENFNMLKDEIQKCILVCSNCHRKIHAGLITV